MKRIILLLALITGMMTSKAQTAEDSVKTVINQLFTAMKTADGRLLKSCFADSAILQTITNENGNVKTETVEGFAEFINKIAANDADERISFAAVHIGGPLAMAWTPYKFYWQGNFSHCGVNSFQLVRKSGEWKIQYLIDTRRKEGCD